MKKPNLLIDGCDCVGKSSIIEELMLTGKFDLSITTQPPKSNEEGEKRYTKLNKILNNFDGLIFDRCSLSEKVYGPILREYYPVYADKLEKELGTHNYLFLITAFPEVVQKRFDGKVLSRGQIPLVLTRYLSEFKKSNYPNKYILDSSVLSPKELSDRIIKILELNGGL